MLRLKKRFLNRGQTLIEALIALSIVLAIMTATTVAVISSLNNAKFIRQQTQANKIAQQGIEYVRDQIMNNGMFATYSGSYTNTNGYCMNASNAMSLSQTAPANGICPTAQLLENQQFSRVVKFSNALCDSATFTNGLRVAVTVLWADGKCSTGTFCHSQEVTSCFIDPSKIVIPTTAQGI